MQPTEEIRIPTRGVECVRRRELKKLVAFASSIDWEVVGEYHAHNKKIELKCPNNHISFIAPSSFRKRGQRCNLCKDISPVEQKFLDKVEEIGWEVLDEYESTLTLMNFTCDNGHAVTMSPKNLMRSHSCRECNRLKIYESLQSKLREYGCEMINDKYINRSCEVQIKCPKGHIRICVYSQAFRFPECPECAAKKRRTKQNRYDDLVEETKSRGWTLVDEEYSSTRKLKFICPKKHKVRISVLTFLSTSKFPCYKCLNIAMENKRIKNEENFRREVENVGGKMIGSYIRKHERIECVCIFGHISFVKPAHFPKYGGMCSTCSLTSPEKAKENFYANLEKIGAKPLEEYTRCDIKVKVICKNNHQCDVIPSSLVQGRGICLKCANICPIDSERKFREKIESMGGKVLGEYKKNSDMIKVLCPKNHICYPRPASVKSGFGMCAACAGQSSEETKKTFYRSLLDANFTRKGEYTTSKNKVAILCPKNHNINLTPQAVLIKGVYCKICDGHISNPEKMTKEFLDALEFNYIEQYTHEKLRRLRFDFRIEMKNEVIYIEVDGKQHQKYDHFFHKNEEEFHHARQRDLLKNYLIRNEPNSRLIRVDHIICKGNSEITPQNRIAAYICQGIQSGDKIVANREIYTWIDDEPEPGYIEKYIIEDD